MHTGCSELQLAPLQKLRGSHHACLLAALLGQTLAHKTGLIGARAHSTWNRAWHCTIRTVCVAFSCVNPPSCTITVVQQTVAAGEAPAPCPLLLHHPCCTRCTRVSPVYRALPFAAAIVGMLSSWPASPLLAHHALSRMHAGGDCGGGRERQHCARDDEGQ